MFEARTDGACNAESCMPSVQLPHTALLTTTTTLFLLEICPVGDVSSLFLLVLIQGLSHHLDELCPSPRRVASP
ncbi:hypothetical protein H9Q72_014100 [Fusarium xylarioides]|uniref:Uncharacterized protein n=1 Tax=Fusarium xylarioides TaxID=221167 RepID=A0A9P7KYX9_9HYPO|nr:hypothetical protein H9Q72_014100 [Fusarium xylarioides]